MGEPTGDETGPDKTEAERLATELSRVRRRGLSLLNLTRGKQQPIEVPILERLASQAAASGGQQDRVVRIQALLDGALDAFATTHNIQVAAFIRQLLADSEGRWPGPGGPGRLLDKARMAEGVEDEAQFRRLQRQHFVEFADFVLRFQPPDHAGADRAEPVALADEPPAVRRRRPRLMLITALVVMVFAITGVVIELVISHTSAKSRAASSSSSRPVPPVSITSTPPATVMVRFDNLGSKVSGGTIIEVYPGVRATTADRTHNGSYNTGDLVRALCVTTGRTVKSDPSADETPRTTNLWVRISSTSGETQYATLTYGEMVPPAAKLPPCTGVG